MRGATPEPRTAVLILVEVSWQDPTGIWQTSSAWMENKSVNGACIRVKREIAAGTKLMVQGRWQQICGTTKYCRLAGKYYLVGVQRDAENNPSLKPSLPAIISSETPSPAPKWESVPNLHPASFAGAIVARRLDLRASGNDYSKTPFSDEPERSPQIEPEAKPSARKTAPEKERKTMQRKWSELMHRHTPEDGAQDNQQANSNGKGKMDSARDDAAAYPAEFGGLQVELLPMEDIYRAAGIANPQKGYSIIKIVEMLSSEHVRGLSKELKRAAVLMALDAAGVPVQQVLRDAKARQEALDAYETEQKKDAEAQWERRAEENAQIQAELERVKAHYMTRIGRNMDGIAREKVAFDNWVTMKQQESQSIAEAVELCSRATVPEPAATSVPPPATMAASAAKPV